MQRSFFTVGIRVLAVALPCCLPWDHVSAQTPGRIVLADRSIITGDIVSVSPGLVEVDFRGETRQVPIESIREVAFTSEPQSLKAARVAIAGGQPGRAAEDLAKIDPAEMEGADQLIVAELDFARAAATGGTAVASGENLAGGEKAVRDYLAKHPQTHHEFPMQELLARLLARSGKYAEAADALAPLDRGPPAFRVRAAATRAKLAFDQGKYDDAKREFEAAAAVATDPEDTASGLQKRIAEVGVARCLSRQGKAADAVAMADRIVGASGSDDTEVLAQAYVALGDACRAAGKDQDAIIAFLTVDLVYGAIADCRTEALFNLVELWDKGKYPQRAEEARQQLATYPGSVWAKKAAAGKTP